MVQECRKREPVLPACQGKKVVSGFEPWTIKSNCTLSTVSRICSAPSTPTAPATDVISVTASRLIGPLACL